MLLEGAINRINFSSPNRRVIATSALKKSMLPMRGKNPKAIPVLDQLKAYIIVVSF